jgi:tRNA (guanine37-N1)-methyltransferase
MIYLKSMKPKNLSITVLTLFPDFVESYLKFGIIKRAIKKKILMFKAVNLRDFSFDERGTVDGRPYGGGVGMVLRPDVMVKAIEKLRTKASRSKTKKPRVILLTPQGQKFDQAQARRLAQYDHLLFISGRYEGFDERIRSFVDEELSIGDYVLMGGELPALVISEAVLRLIPGVLGKLESTNAESFSEKLLEYPQYTKPEVFKLGKKTMKVPPVLLAGHHGKMNEWRQAEAMKRTKKRRPDLLK